MLSEDPCKQLKFVEILCLPFISHSLALCAIVTSPKVRIFFILTVFDVSLYPFKDSAPLRIGGAA